MAKHQRWTIRLAGLATAAALALAPTPGHANFLDDVGQYALDRVHDFADIFRLRTGVPHRGQGYGAKARATALAQAGYVHFNGEYAGMDRRGIGVVRERRTEGGVSVFYASHHSMAALDANEFLAANTDWSFVADRRLLRNKPYWDDGRGDFLGIGAEIATPLLAIDIGLYPSQAVDFLAGFLLIDMYGDDRLDWDRRNPPAPLQTEWGPNPDAATERIEAEIDAVRSRIAQEELEAEGQLKAPQAPAPAEPAAPAARAPRIEGERLDEQTLQRIDGAAREETYHPEQ